MWNVSFLRAAALMLVMLLLVSHANTNPLQERRASTSTLPTLDGTARATSSSTDQRFLTTEESSKTLSSTSRSTGSSASRKNTQSIPLPTENARIASSASGPTATFCKAFVAECYNIALRGQRGEVSVSHSCQRNGGKYSSSFTYSCYRGTERLTPAVLKAMGKEFNTPVTTTIEEGRVVTETIEKVSTFFDIVTTKITTSTVATSTRTTSTNIVEVVAQTVSSTVSSTTIIPYTTSTTSTTMTTATSTARTTVTTTATEVFIGPGEIPVYQVLVPEAEGEMQRRAPSTFCLAFRIACQNECGRVSSRVDVEICDASTSPIYTMTCICKNGKRETQHALEAVAEDRRIVPITKLSTSTTILTLTRSTTLPTETWSTELATAISLLDITRTSTSTSTAFATTTQYVGRSSAVETENILVANTVTTTTTTTTQIPTTTRLVLAETGFVHGIDTTLGRYVGTLALNGPPTRLGLADGSLPGWTNVEFMAVRDTPTGLYQLVNKGDPERGLTTSQVVQVFEGGTSSYTSLRIAPAEECGSSGSEAGPPQSTPPWEPCETFIFSPLALDPTPGATEDTINFRPFFINPLGSTPANHSGAWAAISNTKYVLHVADQAIFAETYANLSPTFVALRFPFPS